MNFAVRLRHKIQKKNKDIETSKSETNESTIRLISRISQKSYLNLEGKYGKNKNLSAGKTDGNYYGADYDFQFNRRLSLKSSFYIWDTKGFSMWNIEDNSIDFMDGDGYKFYFTLTNYLSDNLQLKIFFKSKYSKLESSSNYTYAYIDNGILKEFKYEDNIAVIKTYLNWKF